MRRDSQRFIARLRDSGLSAAVVYADREHFANLSYLTGFDPRFEEALLVVVPGRDPVILTGPENQGTAKRSAIDARCQALSAVRAARPGPQADAAACRSSARLRHQPGSQHRGHRLEIFRP